MKFGFFAYPTLILSLFIAFSFASARAEVTLESLKTRLEENKSLLDKATLDFQENYKKRLAALKQKAQSAGDLDQMIAVENEIKLVDRGGSEIPAKYGELKRLRLVYDEHVKKLNQAKTKDFQKLLRGHRASLLELQKTLTIAGNIEEALQVKREIEKVDSMIQSGAGPASPHPAIEGNKTPGKLVAFGTYEDGSPVTLTSEQQREEYIRVFCGYDHWTAMRPDGRTHEKAGTNHYFRLSGSTKIIDMQCGRHMHIARKENGTVILLSTEDHTNHVPKDIKKEDIAKVSCGHSKNAYLLKDGTLVPFGYSFFHGNITFPRTDLTSDVADMSVGAHGIAVKKKDGSVFLVSIQGEDIGGRPEELKGKDVIQMEGGLNSGTLFLDKKGKVYAWNAPQPPNDLGKAVQIRAGAGLCAAQMENGTWVIWGNNQGVANGLNTHVAGLGPLKDMALGTRYFLAIQ